MTDEYVIENLEELNEAVKADVIAKEDLSRIIDETKRELDRRKDDIEDLAEERDEYRDTLLETQNTLQNFIEEDARALEDMNDDLEELYFELEELDIEGTRRRDTYGFGVFNHVSDAINNLRNRFRDEEEPEIDKERRGYIRDVLLLSAGIGGTAATATYLTQDGVERTEEVDYASIQQEFEGEEFEEFYQTLTDREQRQWQAVYNDWDENEQEFYAQDERVLEGMDVTYREDPDRRSEYRATIELEDEEVLTDWQSFEHDESARDALEYFGDLDE